MDFLKLSKIQMYFWFGAGVVTLIMVIILYFQGMVEAAYFGASDLSGNGVTQKVAVQQNSKEFC